MVVTDGFQNFRSNFGMTKKISLPLIGANRDEVGRIFYHPKRNFMIQAFPQRIAHHSDLPASLGPMKTIS